MRVFRYRVFVAAVALGLLNSLAFAQPPAELFPEPPQSVAPGAYGKQAIEGTFDPTGLASGQDSLNLHLPGNSSVRLRMTAHDDRGDGNAAWRGESDDADFSQAVFTVHQGRAVARIVLDDDVYEIRPAGGGRHRVELIDEAAFPECDVSEAEQIFGSGSSSSEPSSAGEAVVIDLLSVYTANARNKAGGTTADIEAMIQAAVDNANTAFTESGMSVQYQLAHAAEVAYNNAANTGDALDWVTNNSGVAALRDQYGADMVSVIVDTPSSCGTGWVQRNPGSGFANYAFQATDIDCAVGNLTFAHEHGHNMGMEHNPENSSVGSNPDAASYPWSFAHYVSGSYRTVMSYSSPCSGGCPRVMRHSNPGVIYNGYQTGVDGARDNAQTGDLTAPIIADFRGSVNQPSNVGPSASFSFTTNDLAVSFTDLSSDSDGSITSRSWDFGDGNTSTAQNPQHTYASAGTRTVVLTVTDDQGATDTASQVVTVSEPAPPVAQPPAAPSELSASATKSGKGRNAVVTGVALQWTDNSNNETHFVIEACQESGKGKNKSCAYAAIAIVGQDITSFEDASLVDFDRFRVKAVNDEGDSAYSNEARI